MNSICKAIKISDNVYWVGAVDWNCLLYTSDAADE